MPSVASATENPWLLMEAPRGEESSLKQKLMTSLMNSLTHMYLLQINMFQTQPTCSYQMYFSSSTTYLIVKIPMQQWAKVFVVITDE